MLKGHLPFHVYDKWIKEMWYTYATAYIGPEKDRIFSFAT
jgi:hypothetical protein